MTMSVYEKCLSVKGGKAIEIKRVLSELNIGVFNSIFDKFSKEEPAFIIFYILHAYSVDSPWIILGSEWEEEKAAIAERLQVPDYMRPWMVELMDENVRCAVVDYLDYQSAPDFKLLQLKQIQYAKISSAIIKQMQPDDNGNVDTKNLFDSNKELDKLQITINNLQVEMRKKFQFVYIAKEEALKADSKTSNKWKGNIEASKYINMEYKIPAPINEDEDE